MRKKTKRMTAAEKEWIATFGGDEDDEEPQRLSWGELAKLISKMTPEQKKQTVEITESGHDTFGESLAFDKQGNPYIKGF